MEVENLFHDRSHPLAGCVASPLVELEKLPAARRLSGRAKLTRRLAMSPGGGRGISNFLCEGLQLTPWGS